MTKEQLESRIKELQTAIEQSVAQHNALIGRLNEAQYQLGLFIDKDPELE